MHEACNSSTNLPRRIWPETYKKAVHSTSESPPFGEVDREGPSHGRLERTAVRGNGPRGLCVCGAAYRSKFFVADFKRGGNECKGTSRLPHNQVDIHILAIAETITVDWGKQTAFRQPPCLFMNDLAPAASNWRLMQFSFQYEPCGCFKSRNNTSGGAAVQTTAACPQNSTGC